MKKLLYSSLMALMMFFAIGNAQAENAKVKVELSATTWTIGTTAPQFTVTITQATTETGGDEATAAEGDALALGTSAGNVAVKVTLTNAGTTKEQVITQSPVDLVTTDLTAGEWSLTYAFVKGDDQSTTFENVDNDGSTATLTVEAATTTEPDPEPTPALYFLNTSMQPVAENTTVGRYFSPFAIFVGTEMTMESAVMVNPMEGAYKVYYTIDGTTEPTREAYESQTDKENGAIKMIDFSDEDVNPSVLAFTEADNLVVKAKAYVPNETATESEEGTNETIYSKEQTFPFADVTAPIFDAPSGEILIGTKIKITNAPADGQVIYTTDGSMPLLPVFDEDAMLYDDEDGIVITGNAGDVITLKAISFEVPDRLSPYAYAGSKMTTATYTIVRPTVALSSVNPSHTGGSYAAPDTTYGTVMPEFSVKVEGVALGYDVTPVSAIQYKVYRFIEEKDSLVDEGISFGATFEIGNMSDPLPNDTYKIVIRIAERSAEQNENYEWEWTPYTDAEGNVAELTVYFAIAAPVWTLTYPELKMVEDEFGEETAEPFQLRRGKDLEVVIAAENCEGLYGTGDDKLLITKRVYANSLFENPSVASDPTNRFAQGGLNAYYEVIDTALTGGEIRFLLPENWVDSVRKVIVAAVDNMVEAYKKLMEEDGETMSEQEEAQMRAQYALKEEEDLSGCLIFVQAGTLMDMSEYDMGMMFTPAEDYPSMYVSVPFSVIDTIYAPTLSLESGEVTVNTDLWITADLATDTIYYSVDEGAFQKGENNNTVTILLDKDMTVSAYAIGMDGRKSATVSASYTVVEEPVEPTLSVKAVGAEEGETVVFTTKNVAFDMFVKNMVEGDSLFVSIYTKEQYDTMGEVEPTKFAVADSVRFEATLEYGEYVGDFTIVRKSDRIGETVVGEAVTINFTVKEEESAIEAAELAGVNVYPNPSNGTFNVAVPEKARIDIFGLNGAKVMSREANAGVETFSIDHSGIYFVRVMAGNKAAVKRVVVR